jgi:SAM-dependent methyltransferase
MLNARLTWLALVVLAVTNLGAAEIGPSQTNRADSLKTLCQQLGIGPGAVVADVGCGDGPDSMVFASIVGEEGTVLAEEIDSGRLKKVVENAEKRGLHQVVPVLGQSDDPRLPDRFADLIYMNRVFHHFSRPQAMLQHMRSDLKPGGFLVIVDQQRGPLTDWTLTENREKQHHWTSETTVVRLAREAGFLFHDAPDAVWHEKDPFVLVFRRPVKPARAAGDPDLPQPLKVESLLRALPVPQAADAVVVFFGLDRGREVAPLLRTKLSASARLYDIILQEWALSREELPPNSPSPGVEILRTDKGELAFPAEARLDLVLFVDAYHRLWDPTPILERLRGNIRESGWVALVDRSGPDDESPRLANHRRRISAKRVVEQMEKAGFELRKKLHPPAKDRFFLLFGPAQDKR